MGTEVFVRKASGLVRTVSGFDVLIYNLMVVNFGYVMVLLVGWSAWQVPGADLPVAALICTLLVIPQNIVFILLSTLMPRSGGDYVYVSRILHPALGFLSNWLMVVTTFGVLSIAFLAHWTFSILGYGGLLGLGIATNNTGLINFAGSVGTDPNIIFGAGLIVIAVIAAIHCLGTKAYFYFQRILWILGMIAIVIAVGILLAATKDQFISAFNTFMVDRGFSTSPNAYQAMINQATTEGIAYIDYWPATLMAMISTYFSLITSMSSVWFSGEIKRVERSQLVGVLGSLIVCGLFAAGSTLLIINVGGYDFLAASGYLSYAGTSPLPYPTYPTTWIALLSNNAVLQGLLAIGWFAWGIGCVAIWWLIITRSWFAWGFDRVAPQWFADVNQRFHTPVKAIVLAGIMGVIFFAQYTFPPTNKFWATTPLFATNLISFVLVGIAGLILPWRKKDLYETSAIKKYKLGALPLISVMSLIMIVFNVAMIYWQVTWPFFLWTDVATYFSIILIIASFIWFYGFKYYRKRQGFDIGIAYTEIPPD